MGKGTFSYEFKVNLPIEQVWEFFLTSTNLARITTFPKVKILSNPKTIQGNKIEMELDFFVMKKKWIAVIEEVEEYQYFVDRGIDIPFPFKEWVHTHSFEKVGEQTVIKDQVEFHSVVPNFVTRVMLEQMFRSRAKLISKQIGGWDKSIFSTGKSEQ